MKKPMRFASIVLLIGIVISIVAICLGGRVTSVPVFNGTDISDSYVGVKSVDIDLNFSQAQIKIGDEFKIEANNVSKNSFESYVKDGKWYIKDTTMSRMFNILNYRPKVTIYVPEDFVAENVKINVGAGNLEADILNTDNIDMNVGAGQIVIYDLKSNDAAVNCGVGNIEISGIIEDSANIKSGIGNISMNLIGDEKDYNYKLELGIGELSLNNTRIEGTGDREIKNNSSGKLFKVECGIGKISIDINQK